MSMKHRQSRAAQARPSPAPITRCGRSGRPGAARILSGIAGATLVAVLYLTGQPGQAAEVTVYKSPSCGCCGKWVEHMREAGYSVEVRQSQDLQPLKRQLGVDPQLQSCHTAVVDGYVIEGHVPAEDVERLLTERPDIRGLAVPGMPMGAPGMQGPRSDHYDVYAIDKTGRATLFSRH